VFGGLPGGLSQVMALAAERGLDLRAIAIVQTMRVVILAIGVPAGLALFGSPGRRGCRRDRSPSPTRPASFCSWSACR